MVHLIPIDSPRAVEQLWQYLSATTPHSFFLSWHWISTWLRCLPPSIQPMLLSVSEAGVPIAGAVLVKTTSTRRGIISVRTWALNATGLSEFDCISTEYNGLLCHPDNGNAAWREVLEHFRSQEKDWDEIGLEGVDPSLIDGWREQDLPIREERCDVSRHVNLEDVRRAAGGTHLQLLSRNARWKIRKTQKSLESRYGPLQVSIASNAAEAREFLGELKAYHSVRWAHLPGGSDFMRPFAERFHRDLIDEHMASGVIQLARIDAGTTTLGVVYNLIYQNRVSFYQSGMNYTVATGHESPGLLCHSLLIDLNARLGHSHYDFLAGDSPYKRSLARDSSALWWGALQAPRVKLKAESLAKSAYRSMRGAMRD